MPSAFLNERPGAAAARCQLSAAARQSPGLLAQGTSAEGSGVPSVRGLGGPGPASASGPELVQARRQQGAAGARDRNPGEKGSNPPREGRPPQRVPKPLLLPVQSHFREQQKLRAWKWGGSETKMRCPVILVSVKDPFLYIHKNPFYICIYMHVCVCHL